MLLTSVKIIGASFTSLRLLLMVYLFFFLFQNKLKYFNFKFQLAPTTLDFAMETLRVAMDPACYNVRATLDTLDSEHLDPATILMNVRITIRVPLTPDARI